MSAFNPQDLDKWFEAARKEPLMLDQEKVKDLLEQPHPVMGPTHVFTLQNIFIMLGTISTLALGIFFLLPHAQEDIPTQPNIAPAPIVIPTDTIPAISQTEVVASVQQPSPPATIPQEFPVIRPSMETLSQMGFDYQKDQTHFMTIVEQRWSIMLTFYPCKGKDRPNMLMSGEPLEEAQTQIRRSWIDKKEHEIVDRGFYPMYAVDEDKAEVFAQKPKDFHQPYYVYVPVKAPVSLRPNKCNDSVTYYFTPTEAFFDILPEAQGQQLREIYERAKIDASRNIYLYRPMHIETFLTLSKAQFKNLGFTFDEKGCMNYHENVHQVGEVRFKQAWFKEGIEWILGETFEKPTQFFTYPMFITDREGNETLSYRTELEPKEKANDSYLRTHVDELIPVLVEETACSDEFILWFKDMPDFWSQIKKALDAPAQEDEIQTAVSVESIPTYPPVNLHAMKAFPNPASNQLSVEVTLTESDDISLNLLDLNGRLVKTLIPIQRQYQKNQIHSLTLPPIPSGVYVLVLDTQRGGRMTQRLNIQ